MGLAIVVAAVAAAGVVLGTHGRARERLGRALGRLRRALGRVRRALGRLGRALGRVRALGRTLTLRTSCHRNLLQTELLPVARRSREQHSQPDAQVVVRAMRGAELGGDGARRLVREERVVGNQPALGRRVVHEHERLRVAQRLSRHRHPVRRVLLQKHLRVDAGCAAVLTAGDDQLPAAFATDGHALVAAPLVPGVRCGGERDDWWGAGWGGGAWW